MGGATIKTLAKSRLQAYQDYKQARGRVLVSGHSFMAPIAIETGLRKNPVPDKVSKYFNTNYILCQPELRVWEGGFLPPFMINERTVLLAPKCPETGTLKRKSGRACGRSMTTAHTPAPVTSVTTLPGTTGGRSRRRPG